MTDRQAARRGKQNYAYDVTYGCMDSLEADYIKKIRKCDAELAKGWGQIATPLWLETSGHSPEETETVE